MALICSHCGQGGYMQAGLDRNQCLACGGFTHADGTKAVPTGVLEPDGTWEGPGAELLADPENEPFRATNPKE